MEILRRYSADELAGQRYQRPLDLVPTPDDPGNSWSVVLEDFVSAEEGTGIVHMAPAFGSDDYSAGQRHGLGHASAGGRRRAVSWRHPCGGGMFVKDADPLLVEELREAREPPLAVRPRSTPIPTAGGVILPSSTWPGIPGSPPPPP